MLPAGNLENPLDMEKLCLVANASTDLDKPDLIICNFGRSGPGGLGIVCQGYRKGPRWLCHLGRLCSIRNLQD